MTTANLTAKETTLSAKAKCQDCPMKFTNRDTGQVWANAVKHSNAFPGHTVQFTHPVTLTALTAA